MSRKPDKNTDGPIPRPSLVQSDGRSLHVDFDNFTDRLIVARNAGVILQKGSRARVLNDFSFTGYRCAHIASFGPGEEAEMRLVCAWDAPEARNNTVLEFLYRPVNNKPVDLVNWPIIHCATRGGLPGKFERQYVDDPVWGADALPDEIRINPEEMDRLKEYEYDQKTIEQMQESSGPERPVSIELRSNGLARNGTYRVDVIAGNGNCPGVIESLPQDEWIRFILHRQRGQVHLFAGRDSQEQFIGTYPDQLPNGNLYQIRLGNPGEPTARGSGFWDVVRLGRPLRRGKSVAPPESPIKNVGIPAPRPPRTISVNSEKQLFIDNWAVEEQQNINRTFHRPTKHPDNPIIKADRPWEHALYLLGGVEKQRNGTHRIWYHAADPTPGNRKNAATCMATSPDGIHWDKPSLGLYEVHGTRENNIVILEQGSYSIILNPNDPRPEFRYKAHCRWIGTKGWISPDGLHWTPTGVLSNQSLDASSFHYDPVRDLYIGTIKMSIGNRRHRGYTESKDFIRWSDTYLMCQQDALDAPRDEIYAMQIWRYESLYLATTKIFHVATTDTCDIHLSVSHNAQHWQRPFRLTDGPLFTSHEEQELDYSNPHTQPLIPGGEPGSWDYGNLDVATTPPIRHGDQLYFYYSGRSNSHSRNVNKGAKHTPGAIGLATLRVDGFVSADSGAAGGTILTRPLRIQGKHLYVNANAKDGEVCVEILDGRRKAIDGFSTKDCRPIRSDRVKVQCRWKPGSDLSQLQGKTVRLRFHIRNASLYAFWSQ
ncbi:MAG: hypothetical protein CMJ20_09110 [Phycisphaeraceae bacterium]|nr:hypothetical protein [Phycisphaeraceae bacterium]